MTDEIKFIGEMQKVSLKPGDTLVLTCERSLSMEHAERLREHIGEVFPGHKCLVLSDGLKLGVLEKAA